MRRLVQVIIRMAASPAGTSYHHQNCAAVPRHHQHRTATPAIISYALLLAK